MSTSTDWQSWRWMTNIPPNLDTRMQCKCTMPLATGSKMSAAVTRGWWGQHRTAGAARGSWLLQVYPAGVEFDWPLSNYHLRLPSVEGGEFVHAAPPRVLNSPCPMPGSLGLLSSPHCRASRSFDDVVASFMASNAFAPDRGGTHPVLAQSFCPHR